MTRLIPRSAADKTASEGKAFANPADTLVKFLEVGVREDERIT
jgi:hypothetical protein